MSERYLDPRYDATKSERDHYRAMQLGSGALLHRLTSHHPAIIAALQRKAQANRKELDL